MPRGQIQGVPLGCVNRTWGLSTNLPFVKPWFLIHGKDCGWDQEKEIWRTGREFALKARKIQTTPLGWGWEWGRVESKKLLCHLNKIFYLFIPFGSEEIILTANCSKKKSCPISGKDKDLCFLQLVLFWNQKSCKPIYFLFTFTTYKHIATFIMFCLCLTHRFLIHLSTTYRYHVPLSLDIWVHFLRTKKFTYIMIKIRKTVDTILDTILLLFNIPYLHLVVVTQASFHLGLLLTPLSFLTLTSFLKCGPICIEMKLGPIKNQNYPYLKLLKEPQMLHWHIH